MYNFMEYVHIRKLIGTKCYFSRQKSEIGKCFAKKEHTLYIRYIHILTRILINI